MAKPEIETRVDAGPFMPKWMKVKNSYKALKTGTLFKPDISSAITGYDKLLTDYAALKDDLKDMNKILATMLDKAKESVKSRDDATKELTDLTAKSKGSLGKDMEQIERMNSSSDVDCDKVVAALDDLADAGKEFLDKRKGIWDELDGIAVQQNIFVKKARDEYKTRAAARDAKIATLTSQAASGQKEIEGILSKYAEIASDADHDDIVKGLKSLAGAFKKK
jgi:uncharacterized coiled-coil DUF342 family protein